MTRKLLLIAALFLGLGQTAHADTRKTFKKFVADLVADPAAAAKFTDGCELVILPSATGVVRNPAAITLADLIGPTTGKVTVKVKNLKSDLLYRLEAVTADVDVTIKEGKKKTVKHLRASALITAEGEEKLVAAHFALAITDKAAIAAARAGTLASPAAIADQDVDETAKMNLRSFDKDAVASLIDRKGAIALGSGPGQIYLGAKGAKKIRAWKVTLAQDGGMVCGTGRVASADGSDGRYCATNVKATMTSGGKEVTMTYRVLVLFMIGQEDAIVASVIHFSLAS